MEDSLQVTFPISRGLITYYTVVSGGDVVSDDGMGSISIYGETFDDENLDTHHSGAGFVSMANKGECLLPTTELQIGFTTYLLPSYGNTYFSP